MEFLRGVLRVSSDAFYLQMSALEKQHAIVCGEAFPNDGIVKILDAFPLPQSNDPEIGDIFPSELRTSESEVQEHFEEREKFNIIKLSENGKAEEKDEWDELIEQLLNSSSFRTIHDTIVKLQMNKNWTIHVIDWKAVERNYGRVAG